MGRYSLACPGLLGLLLLSMVIGACPSSGRYRINLMPAPAVFEDGDISHEEFGAALADGMLRIPDRTTVYVSSADRALVWARRLFRRERLGQMWTENLPPRTVDFLRANPSLEFMDVTEAADTTTGNGHAYFRKSPWVSFDLLTLLTYDIGAAERGLEKEVNLLVWTFPPDFIERLRKVLTEMNPDRAGARGKADDRPAESG
jgi:hypothetical protein